MVRSRSSRPPATRTSAHAAIAVLAMLHHGTSRDLSPTTLSATQDAIRGSRTAISTLAHPGADALDRLLHIRGRAGVAEAHKMPAVDGIEIDTRRRRHMRLLQEPLGEIEAVVGELRDISVEIECTVDRKKFRQARLRQAFDQDFTIVLVAVLDRVELGAALECRLGRDL